MIRHPLFVLFVFYFITRLVNLTLLPIFTDESNYLEWGWREIHDRGQAFLSLYDAKQPFAMWLYGIAQTLSPGDPLWASRFVSVIAGCLNLFGIYLLALNLFNRKTAVISALLYIVIPFFVFFDRQALMEPLLITVSVWSFYFLIRLHSRPGLFPAVAAGAVLGLGFLTKNTGLIFLITFILVHLYLSFLNRPLAIRLLNLGLLSLISFLVVSSPLLFQSQFWDTFSTNSRFAFTLSELLRFPFSAWINNLWGNLELLLVNLTPPIFFAAGIGIYRLLRAQNSFRLALLFWVFLPLLQYFLVSKYFSDVNFRYLTPLIPLLVIPTGHYLSSLHKSLFLFFLLPLAALVVLLVNPVNYFTLKSKITRYSYITGYLTGNGTGYQVESIRAFIDAKAENGPIYIGMKTASFNPTAAIFVYYRRHPDVKVAFFDSGIFGNQLEGADCLTTSRTFYFISYAGDLAGLDKYLEISDTISSPYTREDYGVHVLKTSCLGKTVKINPVDVY